MTHIAAAADRATLSTSTPLFAFDGVDHWYGSFHALDSISVTVGAGAIGLLGPNGAGKTTLIRTLLGLLTPRSGTTKILGLDPLHAGAQIRSRVGYMPENDCFFDGLSGLDSVVYAARLSGLPADAALRRSHEVLDYAGLGEARYRPVSDYSTGMKQRVKLSQALVHGPDLLLLDEPTNGLDPRGRDEMLDLIEGLSAISDPISVVLSSHLLDDVERVCDRVLLLAGGSLRHYGRIDEMTSGAGGTYDVEVRDEAATLIAILQAEGIQCESSESRSDRLTVHLEERQLQAFWEVVDGSGEQIRHFTPMRVTLERAFIDLLEG